MKPTVYLETTIISYLASWPSRDLVTAAHQQITHDWWTNQRGLFDAYVSQIVVDEASGGNPEAAARRVAVISHMPRLETLDEARGLAEALVSARLVPERYGNDAAHIAIATVHGMQYLLTWNCAHMANATVRRNVERFLVQQGYQPPILCTPTDLQEE